MSEELKRVRKGTKSCTESGRRRKVRCTWSSDDAPKCRRCEERNSDCVAQVYSLHTSIKKRLSSRDRIARLEQQLSSLQNALRADGPNNVQYLPAPDTPVTADDDGSESDDSEFGSPDSDGFTRDPPVHLSTLFENDLISSDTSKMDGHELHRNKALTELSNAVRHKLQELIPPKKEVDVIASFASQWLSVFHALFPAPSVIKSGQEMVTSYDAVKSPSVNPTYLASWLLSIAMTIHQVPRRELGPENQLKGFRNAAQFSRSVSDVVEVTIMQHDALLGTIQGIDTALLFLRLQLSRGNFKKTWLQLRRIIAIAELIGLHRAARRFDSPADAPQEGNVWPDTDENSNARKAQVWESLCSVDRIAGMMFNLPPGTRRYRLPQHMNIISNGNVCLRAYLGSLSEIAMKVQDLDDLDMSQNADAELYATVLKIDGELRVLTSVTPASWWSSTGHLSDQLLQYWHFYITVRVHLPFTLRHDTSEQFGFSRLACMKACQTLIHRYRLVRGQLPIGSFFCRIVDLQAFTGMVVLILAYHASSPMERANLHAQGSQAPEILIPEVLDFMRSILQDPVSDFARQAVDAVSTLTQLLESDKSKQTTRDFKLRVPLLGKLHVRRRRQSSAPPDQRQSADGAGHGMNMLSANSTQQPAINVPDLIAANTSVGVQDDYNWDPLSWSIEDDQSGVFQDALMAEDFSPFGPWWDQGSVEFGR